MQIYGHGHDPAFRFLCVKSLGKVKNESVLKIRGRLSAPCRTPKRLAAGLSVDAFPEYDSFMFQWRLSDAGARAFTMKDSRVYELHCTVRGAPGAARRLMFVCDLRPQARKQGTIIEKLIE